MAFDTATESRIFPSLGHRKGLTRHRLWLFSRRQTGRGFPQGQWQAQVAELVDALASGASDH